MEKQTQAVKKAIKEGSAVYLLEGDSEPKITALYADNDCENSDTFILKGKVGAYTTKLALDDAGIERSVKFSKLFLSEDDARNHFNQRIKKLTQNLKAKSKTELLQMLVNDWLQSDESTHPILAKTMIEKVETEFGVHLNLDY